MNDIQFILALVPNPEFYEDFLELVQEAVSIDEDRATEFLENIHNANNSLDDRR